MASLGSLVIQLAVDSARFQGDLGRAAAIAEARMRNIKDTAAKTIGQLSAIGLAVGGALAAALKSGIDRADDMRDLAMSVGVTVENLTRLQFAAAQSGVSTEQLGAGLVQLAKHLREVGDSRNADQALAAIAEKFSKMPDSAEKTAQALQYFGKSGAALIPLLNEGAAGIRAMMEEADKLGYTISESTAAAADEFNDRLGVLNAGFQAFKTNLAAELLPALNSIAKEFLNTKNGAEAMDKAVRVAATGLKILLTAGEFVRVAFQQLGEGIGATAAAVVQAAQGNFREAWAIMKASNEDGKNQVEASIERIKNMWDSTAASVVAKAPKLSDDLAAPALQAAKKIKDAKPDTSWLEQISVDAAQMQPKGLETLYRQMDEATQTAQERTINDWLQFQNDIQELVKANVISPDIAANRLAERAKITSEQLWPVEEQNKLTAFAEEAARNMQDSFAEFLYDPFKEGLNGMLASFIDVIRRMVAEIAAQEILTAFFDWLGGFGGIVGSFGKAAAGSIAGKAIGGPISAGTTYLVGERGPELFTSKTAGTIIPNNALGAGGSITLNYSIDARGADAERIMAIMPGLLQRTKNETVAEVRSLIARGRM